MKTKYYLSLLILFSLLKAYSQDTPTGSSTEVGITEGILSVSNTGSATYSVAIGMPPGINNVQPEISLTYNSQAGNGLAGYGWNISGISVISRIPSTKFHDDIIDAVDYDELDRFSLDGQRLMLSSGTYGANGAQYQTEIYSNCKITSFGTTPYINTYGPSYFLVEYPDGSKAYYGQTGCYSKNEWAISYWENPQGIRITYQYSLLNNNLVISSVKYGSQGAATPINQVTFNYTTRQKPQQAYVGGSSAMQTKLLSSINVTGNGVGYRNYILAYNMGVSGHERLLSITEKNGDQTKSYNPTVFSYDSTGNISFNVSSKPITTLTNLSLQDYGMIQGDFLGDGDIDYLIYPTTGSGIARTKYWVYDNLQSNPAPLHQNTIGHFLDIFTVSYTTGNTTAGYKLMPKQAWTVVKDTPNSDLVYFDTYTPDSGTPVQSKSYTFPKQVHGFFTSGCIPPYATVERSPRKTYLSGDFNGDAITDLIAIERGTSFQSNACNIYQEYSYPGGRTFLINLDARVTDNFVSYAGDISLSEQAKISTVDVNGDGQSDIQIVDAGIVRVYTLQGGAFTLAYSYSDTAITTSKIILPGDYNGDGKMDFVMPNGNAQDSWNFYFSTGISFVKSTAAIGSTYTDSMTDVGYFGINGYLYDQSNRDATYFSNDINGDGKTDILCQLVYTNYSNGSPQLVKYGIWENKVVNPNNPITFDYTPVDGQYSAVKRFPIPVFTVDGTVNRNVQFTLLSGSNVFTFKNTKNIKNEFFLRTITTGRGVKQIINYKALKEQPNDIVRFYKPSTLTEFYPNADVVSISDLMLVSSLQEQSTFGNKTQSFGYYGAVTNMEGLGFLGFRNTLRTNWYNDDTVITSNLTKYDLSKRGCTIESYITNNPNAEFEVAPTTYISKATMSYTNTLLANKVYVVKNTSGTETNGLNNTRRVVSSKYDIYNNPISTTTSYFKSRLFSPDKEIVETVEYYDSPTGTQYYIGRPKRKTSQSTIGTSPAVTSEELFTYNENQLLTQIQKKGHNTDYLTENNEYDVFGNIIKKTLSAPGLSPRITTSTYDPSGRFVINSKNVEGLERVFTFNQSTGNMLTVKDRFGLTTTYLYDTWGKTLKTTDALGKNSTTTYAYISGGKLQSTTVCDDGSSTISIADNLGRLIIKGVKSIDGTWSYKKTVYDIFDRKIKESEAYSNLSAEPTQYTTYVYDDFGRLTQHISYTGKTTNTTYSGLVTTVNDGIKNVATTVNAAGMVTRSADNGGTINYQYYSSGNLKESDYEGIKILFEEDGWGRPTKITDPSAGIFQYDYNALGEKTKETNSKGSKQYIYNNYGKITDIYYSEGTYGSAVSYVYDPTTKLILYTDWFDSEGDGHNIFYTYDDKWRVSQIEETSSWATYNKLYTYDAFGRINKETITASNDGYMGTGDKSSTITTRNEYKNGYKWRVLDDATSQVLWQVNTLNVRGQETSVTLGNGIAVSNTFDDYGYPTQYKHDRTGSSPANIMTLNNTFNVQTGNLTNRTNSMFGWNENFQYDNLDRLTTYLNERGETVQQSYDNKGRITENNVGTYSYDELKPYQQESLEMSEEGKAYYYNRQGILDGTMENRNSWIEWESYDTSRKNSGTYSMLLSSSRTQSATSVKVPISNAATTSYTISGFMNSDYNTGRVYLIQETAGGGIVESVLNLPVPALANTWISFSKNVSVAANVRTLSIRLEKLSGASVWFDDVKITKTADITTERQLNITYNMYKAPIKITEPGIDKISIAYNGNGTRMTMFYGSMDEDKLARPLRKHYSADGSVEIKQNLVTNEFEFITYLGGDAYDARAIFRKNSGGQEYLYLHKDYQGSIVAITNSAGNIVEKRLFDAWGNVIKVQDGAGNVLDGLTVLDRGYTGHEHLKSVNLINMNGRVYDPKLHRFLQPDNNIQDPYNTQNYNRYGYALNNPLKYSDPSGEFINVIVGAVIGGVVAAISGGNFRDIVEGVMIGAFSGALGGAIGGIVSSAVATPATGAVSGFWASAAVGAAEGFAAGFSASALASYMNGGTIIKGINNGLRSGVIGAISGGLISGISGGIKAMGRSQSFWSGNDNYQMRIGFYSQSIDGSQFPDALFQDGLLEVRLKDTEICFFSQKPYDFGCTWACKNAADDYFGILPTDDIINKQWLDSVKDSGLSDPDGTKILAKYNAAGYKTNSMSFQDLLKGEKYTTKEAVSWMVNEINYNRMVQIGWRPGNQFAHASIVTAVKYTKDYSTVWIELMNPARSASSFGRGIDFFRNVKSNDGNFISNVVFQIFSLWR